MATMTVDRYAEKAHFFEMLSDPVRLRILTGLARRNRNVTQICALTGKQQQAVTHHLIIMKLCDVVEYTRVGKSNIYNLTDKGRLAVLLARKRLTRSALVA